MSYDIIVKGGLIVDGTGRKAYRGDVAVTDGRIVAVGEVEGTATRTIEVDGQVVAPGFLDAHTHYDAQLMWDPAANPATVHGVTTILMGNCGYTLAPVRAEDQDYLMGLFSAAEEVPKGALEMFSPLKWETFPEYLDWLRSAPLAVNVVAQVGHSAVRRFVMGEDAIERVATDDEIAEMVTVVEEALAAGASGVSTSQAPHQRGEHGENIPSYFSTDAELEALAMAVRRQGKRLLSLNPRGKRTGLNEADQDLMKRLAELSGAVVSWNDVGQGTPGGLETIEFMESQIAEGNEILAVARCQRAETRFTFKKLSAVFAASENWIEFSRLDEDDRIAALGDPEWRARLAQFWDDAPYLYNVTVEKGVTADSKKLEGRLLTDIAEERGCTAPEVLFDVAIDDRLATYFRISGPVNVDESKLERLLKSPATLVGISDGGAHLQTFAGGDYTSYFLKHWVKEKGSFTLEEGVQALTQRVAQFLGLADDRGTLEVGKAADIVVFDPDTVEPDVLQTLDDIPGGGVRMTKGAKSIPYVLVNGVPVIDEGAQTTNVPGALLG
jgi:N-acyl-D-amino-acid deacylase